MYCYAVGCALSTAGTSTVVFNLLKFDHTPNKEIKYYAHAICSSIPPKLLSIIPSSSCRTLSIPSSEVKTGRLRVMAI